MCQPQPFPYTPQNSARASGGHSAGCSGDCSFSAKTEKVCLSHSPLPVRWSSSHFLHVCHDRNLNVRGTVSQDAHQHKARTGRTRTEPQQPDMGYGYPKKHPVVSNTCLYLVLCPWHYLVGICNLSASLNNTFQRCLGKI